MTEPVMNFNNLRLNGPSTPYEGRGMLTNLNIPGITAPAADPLASIGTTLGTGAALPAVNGDWMGQLKSFFYNTPFSTTTDKLGNKTQGLFDMGLGTAQGLLGAYLGFQNLGVAKDTAAQNKRQFDLNFDANRSLTNARLEDRQRSRVAWDRNATSVADYMAKNGIK